MLLLTRQATMGRNRCGHCTADNLSRVGRCCTTCGDGLVDMCVCVRCGYKYAQVWQRCIHCTATERVPVVTYSMQQTTSRLLQEQGGVPFSD
jgi:hypothetical protein